MIKSMTSIELFAYALTVNDHDALHQRTVIRMFGLDAQSRTHVVHVTNFCPYLYLMLDPSRKWLTPRGTPTGEALALEAYIERTCSAFAPVKMSFVMKPKLYGADVVPGSKPPTRVSWPFLFVAFRSASDRTKFTWHFRGKSLYVPGLPRLWYNVAEEHLNSAQQMTGLGNVKTIGWTRFVVRERDAYVWDAVSWKSIVSLERNVYPSPTIASFDIEVYSSVTGTMCTADRAGDDVFQISLVVQRPDGSIDPILLTISHEDGLCVPEPIQWNGSSIPIRVVACDDEIMLMQMFSRELVDSGANVVIGYNVYGFDWPYIITRARRVGALPTIDTMAVLCPEENCNVRETEWSSAARPDQKIMYIDAPGRVNVDLFSVVKSTYNFGSYKLADV
ncbi:MAG: hypothetical protein EPO08_20895, partial [Rhodospirillaceae bacterium]